MKTKAIRIVTATAVIAGLALAAFGASSTSSYARTPSIEGRVRLAEEGDPPECPDGWVLRWDQNKKEYYCAPPPTPKASGAIGFVSPN